MDIVIEDESARNGFLASHDLEYAEAIKTIIQMNPGYFQKFIYCNLSKLHLYLCFITEALDQICNRARAYVDLFSEREFDSKWLRALESLINSVKLD